jgi:hypothetical protein
MAINCSSKPIYQKIDICGMACKPPFANLETTTRIAPIGC